MATVCQRAGHAEYASSYRITGCVVNQDVILVSKTAPSISHFKMRRRCAPVRPRNFATGAKSFFRAASTRQVKVASRMARQICWCRLYVLQNSQIVARSRSQGCRAVAIFRARKLRHVQVIKFNADLSKRKFVRLCLNNTVKAQYRVDEQWFFLRKTLVKKQTQKGTCMNSVVGKSSHSYTVT